MKKRIINILKYLFFLSLGFFLLWFITKNQDIEKILSDFAQANYFWILISMLMGIIVNFSRAMRWNMLINKLGFKTQTFTTFLAIMTGYFMNLIVPRLGEITRCGVLARQNRIPLNQLIGTVIAERVFDMVCLLILIILVIVIQFEHLHDFLIKYIVAPLTGNISINTTTIIIAVAIIIAAILLAYFFIKLLLKKYRRTKIINKLLRIYVGFIAGIKTIKQLDNKLAFIFHTVFIWFMYLMMLYVCFFTIDATKTLTLFDGLTVLTTGSLGIVAPVPGGLGTYHFIVKVTLVDLYGIDGDSATLFAYIAHTAQMVMLTIIGSLSFLSIFLINRQKKQVSQDKI